jgi:hopanoid biosynthesis associated protein HpnK
MALMHHISFTADDFGLTDSVNEAVERAHKYGVLNQASLMVGAPAARDAVRRSKTMPSLKTGLHLVLVDGESLLGHKKLPHITLADGRFPATQAALGVKYFVSPQARAELRAEIRAQFAAYADTGLPLHHADAHKHMHLHPTVARYMIEIGQEFGLTRIRIPAEPPAILRRCGEKPVLGDHALYAWTRLLRAQAKKAGLQTTDHVFGLKWSGHMTLDRVQTLLTHLPNGRSEIYFHPATCRDETLKNLMPSYAHEAELNTLLSLAPAGAAAASH